MNTPVRLLVLLALLGACGSPATSRIPTSPPTQTIAAATTSPVASATAAPGDLADALAKAFSSKDADAVGRLMMTPGIGVSAVLEPVLPNDPDRGACCVLNPSVISFVNELRGAFASGALTVNVDPQLQPMPVNSGPGFFVRSDWREADRTTKIDLNLRDMGSGWRWTGALYHQPKSGSTNACLVHYRPPWVPTGTVTKGC